MSGPCTDCGGPDYQTLLARIAELEAHVEHDENNLEGLQGALVRANQRYTQAETARNALFEQFRHVSKVALEQQRRAAKAEAALAERDRELHEVMRVIYEEGWPGTENEAPWPRNDPEHLEAPEYERAMTPEEFLADIRARAEEGDKP